MSSNATILGFHVTSRQPCCMMYRTIAKKFLWEFDSIIMQNLSHFFVHQYGRLITGVKTKNTNSHKWPF